jgi:hypothetical protein
MLRGFSGFEDPLTRQFDRHKTLSSRAIVFLRRRSFRANADPQKTANVVVMRSQLAAEMPESTFRRGERLQNEWQLHSRNRFE